MAWEALTVTHFVAAGAMFLLAGWLLQLNFESRIHRGFALFLFLRGVVTTANRLAVLRPDESVFWNDIAGYFFLGATFALGYFLVVYSSRSRGPRDRFMVAAIALGAVVAEAFYAADHCRLRCTAPDGRSELGPLAVLAFGLTALYAVAGVVLARESLRAPQPARRNAAFFVATAFILQAILESAIIPGLVLALGVEFLVSGWVIGLWYVLAYSLRAGAIVLAAYGLWLLTGRQARAVDPQRGWRALRWIALAAAGSGLYQAIVPLRWPYLSGTATLLTGTWLIVLPALVTLALVRHHLFDAEEQVRWTISRSTIALGFLGAFFVGAEVMQNYLSEAYGWIGGGITAGLLLFALHPLQRMGERLADGVAPRSKPVSALSHEERLDLYRSQATLAWSDGSLGRKERFLLDSLRERLDLTHEEGSRLEREAINLPAGA